MRKRAYATFVAGEKDVVVYDETIDQIKAKSVIVTQPSTEKYDAKTKKYLLDFGKMVIKADGRTYECIEFKKFASPAERDSWVAHEKGEKSSTTAR